MASTMDKSVLRAESSNEKKSKPDPDASEPPAMIILYYM